MICLNISGRTLSKEYGYKVYGQVHARATCQIVSILGHGEENYFTGSAGLLSLFPDLLVSAYDMNHITSTLSPEPGNFVNASWITMAPWID